jgi:hypothetical protein
MTRGGPISGLMGLSPAFGVMGSALVAIQNTVEMMLDQMKEMNNKLAQASPTWKTTMDIIQQIQQQALRPLGEFITLLARPYLMLQLAILRRGMAQAKAIMTGSGTDAEKQQQLQDLFAEMGLAMKYVSIQMNEAIGPLIGYANAIEQITSNTEGLAVALQNAMDWINGVFAAIGTVQDPAIIAAAAKLLGQSLMDLSSDVGEHLGPKLSELYTYLKETGKPGLETFVQKASDAGNTFHNFNDAMDKVLTPGNKFSLLASAADIAKNHLMGLQEPALRLEDAFNAITRAIQDFHLGPWYPFRQIGGVISQEGPYYLHRGERVLSATEKGGSGPTINYAPTIRVDSPTIRNDRDIQDLVKEISRQLQIDMRTRSSYFGGLVV